MILKNLSHKAARSGQRPAGCSGTGRPFLPQMRKTILRSFTFLLLLLLALATTSFHQPVEAAAATCATLLTNDDWAEPKWHVTNSDGLSLFTTTVVHTGRQSAYLGGRHNAADRLSTPVELPDDNTMLTLHFWWQLQSQEAAGGADELAVIAKTQQGKSVLWQLRGRDSVYEWQALALDLTPLAGQTIELQFLSYTDGEQVTDFFIDDVEVVTCPKNSS